MTEPGQVIFIGDHPPVQLHPTEKIKTNDIKKGARLLQSNGWFGTMMDNARGTIRMAEVEGFCTEIGSIYMHDVIAAQKEKGGDWFAIEHTKDQNKLRDFANLRW